MRLQFEPGQAMDVWRYSGTHACTDEDHVQDDLARAHATERYAEGQRLFLMDVRELHVVFGSGVGDLFGSWAPIHRHESRLAVLARRHAPQPRLGVPPANWEMGPTRWFWFAWALEHAERPVTDIRVFEDEREAREYLMAPADGETT